MTTILVDVYGLVPFLDDEELVPEIDPIPTL